MNRRSSRPLSAPQQRMLDDMIPGQWYGDRTADDVANWPAHWHKPTFRQTMRKLRELGKLEFRMREYKYGSAAFNVRKPLDKARPAPSP